MKLFISKLGYFSKKGATKEFESFAHFCEEYSTPIALKAGTPKERVPYFVGADINGAERGNDAVQARHVLTLDVEAKPKQTTQPPRPSVVVTRLRNLGLEGWVYTTFSHTQQRPRYRVVVPLATAIDGKDMKPATDAATRALALKLELGEWHDAADTVLSQAMLLPAYLPGGDVPAPVYVPGEPYSPPRAAPKQVGSATPEDPLLAALQRAGLWLREDAEQPGKHYIRCPFADEHEVVNDSQTVYYAPGSGARTRPGVDCKSSLPSEGHLTLATLKKWLRERGHLAADAIGTVLGQQATEDSIALLFEREMDGQLIYSHRRGKWLRWTGNRWAYENTAFAYDFARSLARIHNPAGDNSPTRAGFCRGVEYHCQRARVFSRAGDEFDQDHYLLNTPDGTVDLRTGQMRPHNPDDMLTQITQVSPAPSLKGYEGSTFARFLHSITAMDSELIAFLQRALGSMLSGAVEDHWLMFWVGDGRNGKNTLGDLVEYILGDYSRKIPASTLLAKGNESHPTELANLYGARVVVSSEVEDGAHWAESRIKEITGDATISARFMHQDFFTFERTHKHLIYGNHRPQLRNVDTAIRSRLKIVKFPIRFVAPGKEPLPFGYEPIDPDMPNKLRREAPLVLRWLLEGHRLWLEAGKDVGTCAAVERETSDYFESQSTVAMWVRECCTAIKGEDNRKAKDLPRAAELYEEYVAWKRARGEQPQGNQRWSEYMKSQFQAVLVDGIRRYRYVALKVRI